MPRAVHDGVHHRIPALRLRALRFPGAPRLSSLREPLLPGRNGEERDCGERAQVPTAVPELTTRQIAFRRVRRPSAIVLVPMARAGECQLLVGCGTKC